MRKMTAEDEEEEIISHSLRRLVRAIVQTWQWFVFFY